MTGSASMSPRSSTDGRMPSRFRLRRCRPLRPAASTAVTELSFRPAVTSSGRPSSAASTFSCVQRQVEPDLGFPVDRVPQFGQLSGDRGGVLT